MMIQKMKKYAVRTYFILTRESNLDIINDSCLIIIVFANHKKDMIQEDITILLLLLRKTLLTIQNDAAHKIVVLPRPPQNVKFDVFVRLKAKEGHLQEMKLILNSMQRHRK